jgi:hypothetical protein
LFQEELPHPRQEWKKWEQEQLCTRSPTISVGNGLHCRQEYEQWCCLEPAVVLKTGLQLFFYNSEAIFKQFDLRAGANPLLQAR